jgi:hypothetical protein
MRERKPNTLEKGTSFICFAKERRRWTARSGECIRNGLQRKVGIYRRKDVDESRLFLRRNRTNCYEFIKEIYRRTVRMSGVGGLQVGLGEESSQGNYYKKRKVSLYVIGREMQDAV